MENIGRPKWLPPVFGRYGTERRLLCPVSLWLWVTTTDHGSIEGKSDVMRSRKAVTA